MSAAMTSYEVPFEPSSDDEGDFQVLVMLKQLWYDNKLDLEHLNNPPNPDKKLRPSLLGHPAGFSGGGITPSSSYQQMMGAVAASGGGEQGLAASSSTAPTLASTSSTSLNVPHLPPPMKKRSELPDPSILQTALKQIVERNGGSAHIDIIVMYLCERYPLLRRRSSSSRYTPHDFKKLIANTLRNYKPAKEMFFKDPNRESCLCLDAERVEWHSSASSKSTAAASRRLRLAPPQPSRSQEPLAALVGRLLQGRPEGVELEEISKHVLLHWAVPCVASAPLEKWELLETVRHCLTFDSLFHCLSEDPYIYTLSSVVPKSYKRGRSVEPDYSSGQSASPDRSMSPVAKRVKPGPKRSSRPADVHHERSIDEKGIWICCDQCGSWVKAEDDGISDISVYDDSNPNHLDYFCPPCRAKNAKKPRGSSKGSSKKPSASALKRMAAAEQAQRPSAPSKIRRPAGGSSSSKRSSARIDDAEDDDSDDLPPSPSEALERHEKLFKQLLKSYNIDKHRLDEYINCKDQILEDRKKDLKNSRINYHSRLRRIDAEHRKQAGSIDERLMHDVHAQLGLP